MEDIINDEKKFIVYRQFFTGLFYTYEKLELDKEELGEYISEHYEELKNIDIYSFKNKVNINLSISLNKSNKES